MLKRKYANRAKWVRIIEKRYSQEFIVEADFKGHVALLCMDQVEKQLFAENTGEAVCIVGNGFQWLQYFPEDDHHSVTVIFDGQDHIVQWYIDISMQNGVEKGIPYMDDLFLDLIVLPTGEVHEKDRDELEEALSKGEINREQYDLAYREFHRVLQKIKGGQFPYIKLAENHKKQLEKRLAAAK